MWAPAEALRKKNGALVAKTPKKWSRERVELKSLSGSWVITKVQSKSTRP